MKRAVALGTFDGIHLGHQTVIKNALPNETVAVTFTVPPKSVMKAESELLMLPNKKTELLKKLGVGEVLFLEFNEVKNLAPKEFLDFLWKKYSPSYIACGFNYKFGKNALGDTELLKEYCKEKGIKAIVCDPVLFGGEIISSTAIRNLIKNGEIEKANRLMLQEFSFESEVVKGDKRGRTLGFPTINQIYPEGLISPKLGVYITETKINDKSYKSVTNIGYRPTFETENVTAETFIIDFSGDLYGKSIEVKLLSFLRSETKFRNIEELKTKVLLDIETAKNFNREEK